MTNETRTPRVMDDKTRRALAGLMPFRKGATTKITLEETGFIPEAERPFFIVRALTAETRERVLTATENRRENAKAWSDAIHDAVVEGLVDWGNMVSLPDGDPLPFSKEAVDEIKGSPLLVRIYVRIAEFSGILEPEREGLQS